MAPTTGIWLMQSGQARQAVLNQFKLKIAIYVLIFHLPQGSAMGFLHLWYNLLPPGGGSRQLCREVERAEFSFADTRQIFDG